MKTTLPRESDIVHAWHLLDAENKVLGRLAVRVANLIMGKHKPIYAPHIDAGDFVVVINAQKVVLTGRKNEQKMYTDYSGYRSGLKETPAAVVRQKHPERMILDAVRRMLPKNRLAREKIKRLKVYPGAEHPHAAQNPSPAA